MCRQAAPRSQICAYDRLKLVRRPTQRMRHRVLLGLPCVGIEVFPKGFQGANTGLQPGLVAPREGRSGLTRYNRLQIGRELLELAPESHDRLVCDWSAEVLCGRCEWSAAKFAGFGFLGAHVFCPVKEQTV